MCSDDDKMLEEFEAAKRTTTWRSITASGWSTLHPRKVNLNLTEERWPDIEFGRRANTESARVPMSKNRVSEASQVFAWALYDWGNSAFA